MGKSWAPQELNLRRISKSDFCLPRGWRNPKRGRQQPLSNQEFFYPVLGQRLIKALEMRLPVDGFRIFRVDMRLRPYGDSGRPWWVQL